MAVLVQTQLDDRGGSDCLRCCLGRALAALGHDVQVWPHRYWKAGVVCTITRDPRTGVSVTGTDPRRPSGAAGR